LLPQASPFLFSLILCPSLGLPFSRPREGKEGRGKDIADGKRKNNPDFGSLFYFLNSGFSFYPYHLLPHAFSFSSLPQPQAVAEGQARVREEIRLREGKGQELISLSLSPLP